MDMKRKIEVFEGVVDLCGSLPSEDAGDVLRAAMVLFRVDPNDPRARPVMKRSPRVLREIEEKKR